MKPLPSPPKEALGRMGLVLLPLEKLKRPSPRGKQFETEIHEFLVSNYNGYTVASGNISGHWKDKQGRDHYGEHREYKVALPNQVAGLMLEVFLANLAHEMDEECIYLEVGSETWLIYRLKI